LSKKRRQGGLSIQRGLPNPSTRILQLLGSLMAPAAAHAPDPSGGGDVVRATATAAASNTFTARMTALAFEHPDKDSNEYKEEAADIWRTPGRVQGRKDNVTAKEMRMAAAQQAGAKRKREEEV
jgi:hypothetical protein